MEEIRCSSCGKPIIGRALWQRRFPDALLCATCWQMPDEISDQLKRDSVARIIWRAHKENKEWAWQAMMDLRGTGLPLNPRRIRRKGKNHA